jgi:prepilin-type processing-associated H-X9-DG protein
MIHLGGSMANRGKSLSFGKKILCIFVGIFLVLIVLPDMANDRVITSLIDIFFTGWMKYIDRVFPQAHWNESPIIFAGASLSILLIGSHLFLRWLCRQMNDSIWKIRWTLSIASLTFLLLLGGMAMMGIAHQTGWLVTSPYRLTERRADSGCLSYMHQIGLAILLYTTDNGGHYPPDLSTLLMNEQLVPENFICPSSDDVAATAATTREAADLLRTPGHCSYIYLGKGLKDSVPDSQVILVEPPQNHAGDGMNVLYGDGHAEWVDRKQAAVIFEKYGLADDGTMKPAKETGQK